MSRISGKNGNVLDSRVSRASSGVFTAASEPGMRMNEIVQARCRITKDCEQKKRRRVEIFSGCWASRQAVVGMGTPGTKLFARGDGGSRSDRKHVDHCSRCQDRRPHRTQWDAADGSCGGRRCGRHSSYRGERNRRWLMTGRGSDTRSRERGSAGGSPPARSPRPRIGSRTTLSRRTWTARCLPRSVTSGQPRRFHWMSATEF